MDTKQSTSERNGFQIITKRKGMSHSITAKNKTLFSDQTQWGSFLLCPVMIFILHISAYRSQYSNLLLAQQFFNIKVSSLTESLQLQLRQRSSFFCSKIRFYWQKLFSCKKSSNFKPLLAVKILSSENTFITCNLQAVSVNNQFNFSQA